MKDKSTLKISVRDLVEFVLKSGDLISSFRGASRNIEAIKAHQMIQKAYDENYNAEVSISYMLVKEDIKLEINGRIDGVLTNVDGVVIDEIKTTTSEIKYIDENYNPLHLAQVKCYAYIYGIQNNLESLEVQLTYFQLDTKEKKIIRQNFTILELEVFFNELIGKYISWAKVVKDWSLIRNESIIKMKFPHDTYRKGQRELAVGVYNTIKSSRKLYACAPTGIGKTLATIFPSIKTLGEGLCSKIFYLTAKTITRTIGENTMQTLINNGLLLKSITITAKEKICFNPDKNCDPKECEYAKGHFDRVNNAISAAFNEEVTFSKSVIEKYAKEYMVCPFEFSLDLCYWCDIIICDYNYVFDPRVYLKRFFLDNSGDYVFLIDEAHNLVDRAREMFSAELYKKQVLDLKKQTKNSAPFISKALNKINSYMIEQRRELEVLENNTFSEKEAPEDLIVLLKKFISIAEKWFASGELSDFKEELLSFYFKAVGFIRTAENYDERYITYFEKDSEDIKIKIYCLDPSLLMKETLKRGKTAIFFSATLTPMGYFMKLLGGEENSLKLKLSSPFERENLCLIIDDTISTKYAERLYSLKKVSNNISKVFKMKRGNYLVFFPSYKYMNETHQYFIDNEDNIKTLCQKPNMNEEEKTQFLQMFNHKHKEGVVGFAVMGGMFGEGIDLVGESLLGAIIVGVGLPQICFERNIIRDYFQKENGQGFEYAYIYPGMNKVMQAVGRVIRSEKDKGVVLLIDDRFTNINYKKLFPHEWTGFNKSNEREVEGIIGDFWNKGN